jgi:putative inorganic carbon (hco3(-)) transporter
MTLARPTPNTLWITVAVLLGMAAAILPIPIFVILLGGLGAAVLFYLEPALALIFALCVAPLKTLIETEASIPLPLDIGQLAFGVFVGIWVLRYIVDKKPPLRLAIPLVASLCLFMFAASLSLWTAYATSAVVTELIKWLQILILVILIPNTRRWEWVLLGVVLSAALQAIIGIWEFRGGSGAAHLWILDYRYFRAFGTFGQPNPFGAFMGMLLPLAVGTSLGSLWLAYTTRSRDALLWTAIFGSLAGIIALGLLVSWSRGAWLGFLAAMVIVIWMLPKQRWIGTLAILGGAAALLLLMSLGLLPASLEDRLIGFTEDFTGFQDVRGVVISDANFAVIERLAHWQSAVDMARTSPLLGVGFGNYEVAYPQFALINWSNPLGHAHNYYLNLLAETGIIGLSSYLILWGVIFHQNWRLLGRLSHWQQRGIAAGLMGTWTHIAIHSLLDKLYVNNLFLHVGAMLGIFAVLLLNDRD